jgi:hypothetical protein
MSWGREKQNAVSKYTIAVPNQGQRAHKNQKKRPQGAFDLVP